MKSFMLGTCLEFSSDKWVNDSFKLQILYWEEHGDKFSSFTWNRERFSIFVVCIKSCWYCSVFGYSTNYCFEYSTYIFFLNSFFSFFGRSTISSENDYSWKNICSFYFSADLSTYVDCVFLWGDLLFDKPKNLLF